MLMGKMIIKPVSGWDISTMQYNNVQIVFNPGFQYAQLFLSQSGDKVYINQGSGAGIVQYPLSVQWDITSIVNSPVYYVSMSSAQSGLYFSSDGLRFYVLHNDAPKNCYQYSMSTAWDLSTASYSGKSMSFVNWTTYTSSVHFKNDGTKVYVGHRGTNGGLRQFSLSTPWDINSASFDKSAILGSSYTAYSSFFSPDGKKVYLPKYDILEQYLLPTAWDIQGMTLDKTFNYSAVSAQYMNGIYFKPDGRVMFGAFLNTRHFRQFSL